MHISKGHQHIIYFHLFPTYTDKEKVMEAIYYAFDDFTEEGYKEITTILFDNPDSIELYFYWTKEEKAND